MTLRLDRRRFLASTAAWAAAGPWALSSAADRKPPEDSPPTPMLHVSDLFRPHNDPDDHWDLACAYALAWQSRADLRGVLIDFPQPGRQNDPDLAAVGQLNYLTGLAVPVMVGSPQPYGAGEAGQPQAQADLRGVRAFLELLRSSPQPVVISILGSCRDVAIAGRLEPELFARQCAGVYLNAGSGTPDRQKATRLEWNVHLDPASYAAIFDLPCPVYWMPCFEEVPGGGEPFRTARYGTFYRFRQSEILPQLSPRLQNFFAYMYRHGRRGGGPAATDAAWLAALLGPRDEELLQRQGALDRNMWCTAGFLHACGLCVLGDGQIVPRTSENEARAVYVFEPVTIDCSAGGVTHWQPASAATRRYLFQVRDVERYPAAMTAAMKTLLGCLP